MTSIRWTRLHHHALSSIHNFKFLLFYTGRNNGPVQSCMGVHSAWLWICVPRTVKHTLPRGWICCPVRVRWWALDGSRLPRGKILTHIFISQMRRVTFVVLQLYICDAAMDTNVFTGEKFTCPEGEMVVLDIANGNPFNYTCVDRTLREYINGARKLMDNQ